MCVWVGDNAQWCRAVSCAVVELYLAKMNESVSEMSGWHLTMAQWVLECSSIFSQKRIVSEWVSEWVTSLTTQLRFIWRAIFRQSSCQTWWLSGCPWCPNMSISDNRALFSHILVSRVGGWGGVGWTVKTSVKFLGFSGVTLIKVLL